MSKAKKMKTPIHTQIEQAIAFGRSPDWMVEHLGVTDQDIDAAMRRLDECNREVDDELVPCGTHTAFNRHKRLGEEPCSRCRYAEADYQTKYDRKRRPRRPIHMIGGRAPESYYGAADPSVIAELIDAVMPPRASKQRVEAA